MISKLSQAREKYGEQIYTPKWNGILSENMYDDMFRAPY